MANTEPFEQSGSDRTSNKCHWLPCSIDHDGLAPVHVYFRPESIPKVNETALSSSSSTYCSVPPQAYAASFRGRGLIAASNVQNNLPKHVIGSVMMPTTTTTRFFSNSDSDGRNSSSQNQDHNKMVVTKERFDGVLEWEHESDERKTIHEDCESERIDDGDGGGHGDFNTQTRSSVGKGLGILEILRSVHDPIPI